VKKTAVREDDEARPVKKPAKSAEMRTRPEEDIVEISDDEDERDGRAVAAADDIEEDIEEISALRATKQTRSTNRRTTRFYFRAGGIRQTSSLGATEFDLQTSLPVDTSQLGAGSGVEMQQDSIPVGVIVGFVLPVWNRRLSVETILGFPTKTRFRATGKLADESLAPTFMGLPTGIEPLGPDLGEATISPPLVTAVYRVADLGPVTPIIGTGVMVLLARGARITNPVLNEAGSPELSISPSPGLVLQGGLEVRLSKRFAARFDVKYVMGMKVAARVENISVTPKAIPQLGSLEVGDAVLSASVTPLVFQAGIGADF
jgi:outer membrane protein W